VNTWGRRTRPAARDGATIALLHYEIRLPDPETLGRLAAALDRDAPQGGRLEVDDPTGIRVRFTTRR
jgi:catechol-2,3-dioxygenase